jgi:hypothetical protein
MDSEKLRKNINFCFNGIDVRTSYTKYKYSISYDESEHVQKSHKISENKISLAFDNYTRELDTELYVNSYRPDNREKFMINPDDLLVELDHIFISGSPPISISPFSSIEFKIIATDTENIQNKIRIIPHIDGVSTNSSSNIFEIPNTE